MRLSLAGIISLAVLTLMTAPAQSQNLVQNPGFETGDFSNWTTIRADRLSNLVVSSVSNTGSFAARFGAANSQDDRLTQTLVTTPGGQYTFSFWLRNSNGVDGPDHFSASFDGNTVYEFTNGSATSTPGFTLFSFGVSALTASTEIVFAGYDRPDFIRLDDVSVVASATAAPEPGSLALLLPVTGAVGMIVRRRRHHRCARASQGVS